MFWARQHDGAAGREPSVSNFTAESREFLINARDLFAVDLARHRHHRSFSNGSVVRERILDHDRRDVLARAYDLTENDIS